MIVAIQLDETEEDTTDLGWPGGVRIVGVDSRNTVRGHVIIDIEEGQLVVREIENW